MSNYNQGYFDAFTLLEEVLALPPEIAKSGVKLESCPEKFDSIQKVRDALLPLFVITMSSKAFIYFRAPLQGYLYVMADCQGGQHVANFAFAHYLATGFEDYAGKFTPIFQKHAFEANSPYILKSISQDFASHFIEDRWRRVSKRINLLKEVDVSLNASFTDAIGEEQKLADLLAEYDPESEAQEEMFEKAKSSFEKAGLKLSQE
ncbi:hypothetical protein WK78_26265 [Burkholderia cepacia]|uniref:hypothetical protein n=1 Tax=Burkholderia cepacia TaxID=292 RepID=UPI00075BB661|nr:hypothetical protein [Burkholderia cepacia]KVV20816.1 hypothetical protein WK78_26265 [Burkholderia cepacia]